LIEFLLFIAADISGLAAPSKKLSIYPSSQKNGDPKVGMIDV